MESIKNKINTMKTSIEHFVVQEKVRSVKRKLKKANRIKKKIRG